MTVRCEVHGSAHVQKAVYKNGVGYFCSCKGCNRAMFIKNTAIKASVYVLNSNCTNTLHA